MPPRPTPVLLAVALLVAAGCDAEERALGTWELATIDGVGPAVAAPVRVNLPAGAYGSDTIADNGMWHEYTVDSLVLTLEPGGTFRERMVEAKRARVRQNPYERPDYVSGAFGGDLIRDDAEPQAVDTEGSWTLAGDSLVLSVPQQRSVESMVARVRQALPAAPEDAVRAAVEGGLAGPPRPRWTGTLAGDRIELRDPEGRVFTFRRARSG